MPSVTGKVTIEKRETSAGPPPVYARKVTITPTEGSPVDFNESTLAEWWETFVGNAGATATVVWSDGPPQKITQAVVS